MYIHARTPARAHTPAHPHARTRTRMHMHAPMHLHACTHPCTPACMPARTYACTHPHAPAPCTCTMHARTMHANVSTASTIALERIKTACSPFLACSPYQWGSTCEKRLVGAVIDSMHVWTQKRKNPSAIEPVRDHRARANA